MSVPAIPVLARSSSAAASGRWMQGGAMFSSTGFILDGTRTLQLGGASTATGTSAQIQLNGSSAPGSGTLTIAGGASFIDHSPVSLNILASNFGGTDTGATATVNN